MMKKGILPRQTFIFATALFLIWLQPLTVIALKPSKTISNYIHNVWTTKDGLPQNTIYSIAQDTRGYVWIGTDRGLVRYDGLEFKHFNKSNTPAIKNDSITTLFIAGDQTMWVGTYGGGIALYKNNHFYAPTSIDKLPNLFIQSITEDKENNIWIGTIGGGIIHFKDNLFSSITSEVGLSNDIVSTVLADSKGKLWIGTSNGLDCLENGEFTKYKVEQGLLDNNIKTLYEDRRGNLWIGTTQGVNKIRNRESDLQRNRFLSYTTADGLSDNYVRAVREDRHGSIWIATNGGLNRINGNLLRRRTPGQRDNEIKFEHFTSIDGLSDNSLQSIYEDRWGNMWIGTSGGGLNALRDGKFTFYTVRDGLASNSVKAIYEAPDDSLWIGTDGAGLNRRKDGKFDLYTVNDGLSSNNIESIGADWNGNVWIGTTAGLDVFNGKRFKRFSREDGLSNSSIKTIYRDQRGDMWIGTFGGGLNRFKNGKFTVYDKIRGLSDDFVLSITEDDRGSLWVGTKDGLNRFKNGSFKTFTTRDGLSGNMIMDTYADDDGALWIATNGGGLNRLKNGRITSFKSGIGEFSNNVIYRIIEDAGSNLWMSSNQGIFSVSRRALNRYAEGKRDTLFPYHFKEEDGLKTSVCSGGFQPAGWKTGNGKIWFPTHKGIAMIDLSRVTFRVDKLPEVIEPKTTPSPVPSVSYMVVVREQPVVIDKVMVDGDVIDMQKDYIFSPDSESIQFHFTLLNYTAPDKIVFKYRLWGLDDRWGEIVGGNKVVYRNVPTGRYTFRVLARTSHGDWVYRGDSYSFFVDQRFYQSFWFYFIITIVVVTAVVTIPRLLEKRTNEKEVDTEKYKSSSLSDRRSEAYLRKLLHLMDTEKPYLDPNLSLQTMSDKVGCTKENLSQVINEQTDLNFKNFLNKYRVEEAKKKLADPKENQYVLMKIAYDVGFNSKSVFNAAFKKFTGISPSQYKKQVQI